MKTMVNWNWLPKSLEIRAGMAMLGTIPVVRMVEWEMVKF